MAYLNRGLRSFVCQRNTCTERYTKWRDLVTDLEKVISHVPGTPIDGKRH
jgi:hypothetical protein